MTEPADGAAERAGAGVVMRAGLTVGGATLARHQLALALALGCERIICLAPRVDTDLVALQHVAEQARASLHRAAGASGLLGLVSTADEVIAFGDGLLAWPDIACTGLGDGPVVLVQPAETGLMHGFERVDATMAAAGAIRVPGRLIERLAEQDDDCDVFSMLMRLALQAGVAQRPLPPVAFEAGRWNLVRSEAEAHSAEPLWMRLLTAPSGKVSPAMAVARQGVRWFGPALLHAGSSGMVVAIAGAVTLALALVLGWFALPVAALGLAAWGWVLLMAAALLRGAERKALRLDGPGLRPLVLYAAVMDAALLVLLTWLAGPVGAPLWQRAFAPVVLLGLLRLVGGAARGTAGGAWLEDRAMVALVLMGAALTGWLGPAVAVLALAVLVFGLFARVDNPG